MATSPGSDNILPTTTGVLEEQTLRHIIRTSFANGMDEDIIAFIMREILKALDFLHVSLGTGHTDLDSSNICVNTDEFFTTVKLALDPGKQLVNPGLAWSQGRTPTDGIWGLGISALEMGYGSLPSNCNGREDLVSLANNVIRILKLKLGYPDKKGKEKAKNKGKEKLESADDQKLKERAIQKGKGKLVIDDDQEMKEKAMQKGKEKLTIDDDQKMKEMAMLKGKEKLELAPKGKEMAKQKGKEKLVVSDDQELKEKAKQKGKEKLEIADEEPKKSTIRFPVLEKLQNVRYVEYLEKKLKKKKAMAVLTGKFKKAMNLFRKNKNDNADESEFSIENDDDREFSRDFLAVVLMCLEEHKLTPAKQILEHPFFQQTIDQQKFDHSIRSRYFHC